MSFIGATFVAFLYRRLLAALVQYVGVKRFPDRTVELVGAILCALLYLWVTGADLYLAVPAYGAALLLHRLDDLMMAKADESVHNIMKNRR